MTIKTTLTITRLPHGWYNFESIPQGYIKVANLCCITDRQAMKQAEKLNKDFEYEIKDVQKTEVT